MPLIKSKTERSGEKTIIIEIDVEGAEYIADVLSGEFGDAGARQIYEAIYKELSRLKGEPEPSRDEDSDSI